MTNFTRRAALGMAGGAAVLPLLGSPALANTKLTVGALRFTSHAASFVAYERGYFTDEGLDVEFKFFEAAQPMAVAIASQDADFGVTSITGGLISLAEKGAAKVIAGALSEEKGIDGQMSLASNAAYDAGLTAPAALDGKSFAVTQPGSSFHYMGAKIAEAEGVSLSYKPLQKVGAVVGAIKSGQIDAWNIVPHIAKPLAGSGAVHIIGAVQDYLPGYQTTTVFTSAKNAADQRDKTEAFLAGFSKGVADYNSTMIDQSGGDAGIDEMVKLIHQYVYADRPFEKAKPSIVNGTMRINEGAKLNMASVKDQLEWFQSGGYVDASVTIDDLVDTSYVEIVG